MAGGDGSHMMWNDDPTSNHYSDMFMLHQQLNIPTYDQNSKVRQLQQLQQVQQVQQWDGDFGRQQEDCCTEQDCTREDICEVHPCCPQCKGDSCTDICKDPTCLDKECAVGECEAGDCDAGDCNAGDCGVGKCDADCPDINCEDPHCSIAVPCEDDNCSVQDFCCCGDCQGCQDSSRAYAHHQWMQMQHIEAQAHANHQQSHKSHQSHQSHHPHSHSHPHPHPHPHDNQHYANTTNHYHSTPQYSNIYDYSNTYDPIPTLKDRETSVTTISTSTDILTPNSTQWVDNCHYSMMDKSPMPSQMQPMQTQIPYLTCDWSSCGEGIPPDMLFQHFQNAHLQAAIESNNCSWAGCGASFSQQQDLLQHFGTAHMPSTNWMSNGMGTNMGSSMGNNMENIMANNNISRSLGNNMGNGMSNGMSGSMGTNMNSNLESNNIGNGGDTRSLMTQFGNEQAMIQAARYITPDSSSQADFAGMDEETDTGTAIEDVGCQDVEDEFVCRWRSESHGFCGKRLDSAYDLLLHLKKDHVAGMEIREPKEFFCQWEGCDRIGKPFKQRGKVERHVQTHVGYKSICCGHPGCRREFANETLWLQHYRRHTGERPYVCEFEGCGKRFAQGSAFTMHKRSHTGERPLQCNHPGCGKRFAESSNLAKHRKTHNPIATLQCPFNGCSKSFRRMDQYKRHYKKQHGNDHTVPPPPVHRKESVIPEISTRMLSV